MNWSNLREHKCPQCSTLLQMGAMDLYINCQCGFSIALTRYEEIMTNMTMEKKHFKLEDNQSELNNL